MIKSASLVAGLMACASVFPAPAAAKVPWFTTFSKAEARSQSKGRMMFLFFTDGKQWSRRIRKGGLSAAAVASRLRSSFIPVRLRGKKNVSLVRRFNVTDYPAFRIVNVDGVTVVHKSGGSYTGREVANWLDEAGAINRALKRDEGAIARNPKDARTGLKLAKAYYKLAKETKSVEAYRKVISVRKRMRKDPGKNFRMYAAWSHAALAERFEFIGKKKQAARERRLYMELDSKNKFGRLPFVLAKEAEILRKNKRFKEAIALLEKPARKFKKDDGGELLSFHLGLNYYQTGKAAKALSILEEFVERHPDSEKYRAAKKMVATISDELSSK